jgi:acyl-CoA synthetase (AMP-forming)/AMP-acid ligase II/acyl carrier protein
VYPLVLDFVPAFLACLLAGVVAVPAYPPDPSNLSRALTKLRAVASSCTARHALTTSALQRFRQLSRIAGAQWPKGLEWHTSSVDAVKGRERGKHPHLGLELLGHGVEPQMLQTHHAHLRGFKYFTDHPDALSMLQYTSGSTGFPKGVEVTHSNLQQNCDSFDTFLLRFSARRPTCCVWMPLYHDFGLSLVLGKLLRGGHAHLMSPATFLMDPFVWIGVIAASRAVCSAAPCFALDLVLRKIDPQRLKQVRIHCVEDGEMDKTNKKRRLPRITFACGGDHKDDGGGAPLDLSTWLCLGLGGEPNRVNSLISFSNALAPYSFDPRAFCPGFGQAEAVCGLLFPFTPRQLQHIHKGDRWPLSFQLTRSDAPAPDRLFPLGAYRSQLRPSYLSVGFIDPPVSGVHVCIVEPNELRLMREGEVGELWCDLGSKCRGYFGQPDLSQSTFHAKLARLDDQRAARALGVPPKLRLADDAADAGTWLRTGDLAFYERALDGTLQVFICGRLKDLLIVRGVNIYPQDVEIAAESASQQLRPGCSAAFAVNEEEWHSGLSSSQAKLTLVKRNTEASSSQLLAGARELAEVGEGVILVCEVRDLTSLPKAAERAALCDLICSRVREDCGILPLQVLLIPPRHALKTSSGKIRRADTKLAWLAADVPAFFSHFPVAEIRAADHSEQEGPIQRPSSSHHVISCAPMRPSCDLLTGSSCPSMDPVTPATPSVSRVRFHIDGGSHSRSEFRPWSPKKGSQRDRIADIIRQVLGEAYCEHVPSFTCSDASSEDPLPLEWSASLSSLGLSSLALTRLLAELRDQLNIKLTPLKVYSCTTLDDFLSLCELQNDEQLNSDDDNKIDCISQSACWSPRSPLSSSFSPRAVSKQPSWPHAHLMSAPATLAQQRIYLDCMRLDRPLWNGRSGNECTYTPYVITVGFRVLSGGLSLQKIEAALHTLLCHHPSLRTGFSLEGPHGELWQHVQPSEQVRAEVCNAIHLWADNPADDERSCMQQFVSRSFDLEHGRLARLGVYHPCGVEQCVDIDLVCPGDVLLFAVSHIALDGWSARLLMRQVLSIMKAFSRPETSSPAPSQLINLSPASELQCTDIALRERSWISGVAADLLEARSFWRTQFAGMPSGLHSSSCRHPRNSGSMSAEFRVHRFSLMDATHLHTTCIKLRVTPFALLLASVQLLLHNELALEDMCVSGVHASRGSDDARLIGMLVNTLPFRSQLRDEDRQMPWTGRVQQVQRQVLECMHHGRLPLQEILKLVDSSAGSSCTPAPKSSQLFAAMVLAEDDAMFATSSPQALGCSTVEPVRVTVTPLLPISPLQFTMRYRLPNSSSPEQPVQIEIELLFDSAMWETARAALLLQQLVCVMCSATEFTTVSVMQILQTCDRLRQVESDRLMHALEPAGRLPEPALPPARSLGQLFIEQFRAPNSEARVALELGGHRWSYAEVGRLACRTAASLRAIPQVTGGVVVAQCAQRGLNMVLGMLACQLLGTVYCPLNPDEPDDRLSAILHHSAAVVLLSSEDGGLLQRCRQLTSAKGQQVLVFGVEELVLASTDAGSNKHLWDSASDVSGCLPTSPAYLITTSGSTGTPKLLCLTSTALLASVGGYHDRIKPAFTAEDVHLQMASCAFDMHAVEIYGTLAHGGRLVLLRHGEQRDVRYVWSVIGRAGVRTAQVVPSMMQAMVEVCESDQEVPNPAPQPLAFDVNLSVCCHQLLASVVWVLLGEALHPSLLRRIFSLEPSAVIWNVYGPAETICVTSHRCTMEDAWSVDVPIGLPTRGVELQVLSADNKAPAIVGEEGILFIAGPTVFTGYWRNDALTATVLHSEPTHPNRVLYRTGDRVHMDWKGELHYVGVPISK